MHLAVKTERRQDTVEVYYSSERWRLLQELRESALRLLDALGSSHIQAMVHGSVARGDIRVGSDVDAFIPNPPSSFRIETALERAKVPFFGRVLIQATPQYAVKAYIEVGEATTVSFPLSKLRRVEQEFYRFSGEISIAQLEAEVRVAGIDKRLKLIEPTQVGHIESSVCGREDQVAKQLGISVETVMDRVRALNKRDAVGRTGVFLKRELGSGETFEMALSKLAKENPAVRRRLGNSL